MLEGHSKIFFLLKFIEIDNSNTQAFQQNLYFMFKKKWMKDYSCSQLSVLS